MYRHLAWLIPLCALLMLSCAPAARADTFELLFLRKLDAPTGENTLRTTGRLASHPYNFAPSGRTRFPTPTEDFSLAQTAAGL